MFTQYFGQYLLNKGYISLEQLHIGLESQKETKIKLGVLAVNAEYMSADDAHKINEAQKKSDKKFGEMAIELGYLKQEQVEELLNSQKLGQLLLGQVLIDKGYITIQEFERAINDYKKDYSISEEELDARKRNDVDNIIQTYIKFEGSKNEKQLKDYLALFRRNLIRFIDSDANIKEVIKVDEYESQWIAKQEIKGQLLLSTFIEADENSFIKFAAKYAEEELNIVDEMAKASVGEFLNLQNGIFLVNLSNAGIDLEMSPQEVFSNIRIRNAYKVSVDLSFGKINILIKEE